jgi:hypothetical protein
VTVWTRLDLPGFHHWPNATGPRAYLAERHRHLFRVTVRVRVSHDDRAVEFHDLQDLVRDWWGPGTRDWNGASCEAIARALWAHLADDHALTPAAVDVSEDDECGATVTTRG